MKRLLATGVLGLLVSVGACDCGGPPEPPGQDASHADAAHQDSAQVDAGPVDHLTLDAAGSDAAIADATGADTAASDASAADAVVLDGARVDASDAAGYDAGPPQPLELSIKVDELGTSAVSNVHAVFVRFDPVIFGGQSVCEDGGVADAAGSDAGAGAAWRTDVFGQPATLASVSRSVQHFSLAVPGSPPRDQLSSPPNDPCGVQSDTRTALYLPYAYLESGSAAGYDDDDDIIGMGDRISYASGTGQGHIMLAWAEGSSLPFGLQPGWNLLVVGLYDNSPDPERLALNHEIALSITATPHPTLDVSGAFVQPGGGGAVTTDTTRRVALLANRRLGGVSEIVAAATTGTTYALTLPDQLNSGSLDEFIVHYGAVEIATGSLVTYLDANNDQSFDFSELESSADESCPARTLWYLRAPLPWPWVLMTQAQLARGYNVIGRAWNLSELQVQPALGVSKTAPIDINIPRNPDRTFTDNTAPAADTGCACGVIPAPYAGGCN